MKIILCVVWTFFVILNIAFAYSSFMSRHFGMGTLNIATTLVSLLMLWWWSYGGGASILHKEWWKK